MRKLLKWWPFFLTLLALLVIVRLSRASTTTITGTIKDAFQNPVTGTLVMQLPVPAQDTTTNTLVTNTPIRCNIVNGSLSGCPPVFDVANLQPQNLYYITRAYDSSGALVLTGNFPITGGSYNLGAAAPTSVTTSNISYINPASLSGNNTWTGLNTWTQQMTSSVPTGTAPFSIASTTVVPNLNVNTLNGVVVSGTPSTGQSLQATSPTTGTWVSSANVTSSYPNQTPTGTVLNQLVKLTGAPSLAVQTAITDTGGAIGICVGGCTTSGSASVTTIGQASCIFDAGTTAGDYVIISPNIAGNCKDSGATYPSSGQVLGRVLSTNGGAGAYNMTLFGTEFRGSTPAVTINPFSATTLGGDVAVAATTATTVMTRAITMPASGCPCRVFISYSLYITTGSSGTGYSAWVSDSVNNMAGTNAGQSNGSGGALASLSYSGYTTVTYANGANVTFTLTTEGDHTYTVKAASQLAGSAPNSSFQVAAVSSN